MRKALTYALRTLALDEIRALNQGLAKGASAAISPEDDDAKKHLHPS